jgi:energy-coupling factor transporter ATP-binding protein EcfA2
MTANDILQRVTRGLCNRPQKVVIYGPEGVGKTTLAAQCPGVLFVDTEDGTGHIDVPRVVPSNLQDVEDIVTALSQGGHQYKTLVIDTVDWLESLMVADVLARASKPGAQLRSIEDFGYGKGYQLLAERMREFLDHCAALLRAGVNVVLLAHSRRVKFEAPESAAAYDKYELKLTKCVSPLVKEWSDALLFVNFVTVVKDHKGIGGNERVIYTTPQAPWEAKNRQGLPDMVPADDAARLMSKLFAHSLAAPRALPDELTACLGQGLPVTAYLRSLGWLSTGDKVEDLSDSHLDRIARAGGKFAQALHQYAAQVANATHTTTAAQLPSAPPTVAPPVETPSTVETSPQDTAPTDAAPKSRKRKTSAAATN